MSWRWRKILKAVEEFYISKRWTADCNEEAAASLRYKRRASPLMYKISVNNHQSTWFYFQWHKFFLTIGWGGAIKMSTIFISDHSPFQTIWCKTLQMTKTLDSLIAKRRFLALIIGWKNILLCDPGIAHRQPLVIVASSSASHNPVHDGGSV